MKIHPSLQALLLLLASAACASTTEKDVSTVAPPAPEPCRPGEERTVSGIVFVRICAGTFTMGTADGDPRGYVNERPAHQVTLNDFWIAKTETTNAQYRAFRPDHPGEPELPVTHMSWNEAKAACERFGGRLPTEAEWEYAARAGSTGGWAFGDDEQLLGEYAWFTVSAGDKIQPVGQKKPNAWGLYDLHGNVWEWVADGYGPYPAEAQTDPQGVTDSPVRVLRGGSSFNPPRVVRSAFRQWVVPVAVKDNFGFRCALAPERAP